MKFLPLILRNLLRRPVPHDPHRSCAIAGRVPALRRADDLRVAFTMGVEVAGADRLMMMNKMGFIQPMPHVATSSKIRSACRA